MYALADLILGRHWEERHLSFQGAIGLDELHLESLGIHASLGLGFGLEYIPINRLVIRAEFAFAYGYIWQQTIDRLEDNTTELAFFPQETEPRSLVDLALLSEFSIGWRF